MRFRSETEAIPAPWPMAKDILKRDVLASVVVSDVPMPEAAALLRECADFLAPEKVDLPRAIGCGDPNCSVCGVLRTFGGLR